MDGTRLEQLTKVARLILTIELFLGGQARTTPILTPGLYKRVMAKAEGTQRYLAFIPIQDPKKHTHFIGALMMMAGVLLIPPDAKIRLAGGLLSISLTLAGVYSQYMMGIPYWLPTINTVLAASVIYHEAKGF